MHRGDAGPGLTTYLSSSADLGTSHRVDVRRQPAAVRSGCQPDRIPLGRWPADPDHSLILSQQFAVNQVMEQLTGTGGLCAVNGPPGTGKTTMLRDLIAAIVVQRALLLAELASPHDAFSGTTSYTWATSTMRHKVVAPRADLTGFEIAVASANNGAVENVTTEIPGPAGIGPRWRERAADLGYFTDTAGQACADGAWALVAAKPGNRMNRSEFVQRLWWSDTGQDRRAGMRDVLKSMESTQVDWAAEVARFTEAADTVRRLAAERQSAATAIERLSTTGAERARTMQAFRLAEQAYRQLERQLRDTDTSIADVEAAQARADAAYVQRRQDRPGLLVSLSTRFRAGRQWQAAHLTLRDEHRDAARRRDQGRQSSDQLRGQLCEARAAGERACAADQHRSAGTGVAPRGRAGRRTLREPRPGRARIHRDDRRGPGGGTGEGGPLGRRGIRRGPDRAVPGRLAAAQGVPHRRGAPTVRRNLNALMDVLDGRGARPTAAARAGWQTFFLMVPVVSSAFASIGRLFGSFGRESLGWLLIDEAGQAAPQQAAGAIWRARLTVVVGDPLQIEPVVTMPWGGQQALGRLYAVPEEWAPSRTSVQRVADRAAPYGTWLPAAMPDGSGHVWVGTPLRVHRRCDRPIFDVCNRIAYDGLMVYGTPQREPFHGGNAWYDVRGTDARGH